LRDLHILMEVVQWASMVKAANHLGVAGLKNRWPAAVRSS
jgi:hypothetical protein